VPPIILSEPCRVTDGRLLSFSPGQRTSTMKLFVLLVVAIATLCDAKKHHYKYPIKIDDGGLAAPNLLDDSHKDSERTELIGAGKSEVRWRDRCDSVADKCGIQSNV